MTISVFSISVAVSRVLTSTISTGPRSDIRFTGEVSSQTVSSEVIDKIDIYAGGYGAEFGVDSQAVLAIHSRDSLEERTERQI